MQNIFDKYGWFVYNSLVRLFSFQMTTCMHRLVGKWRSNGLRGKVHKNHNFLAMGIAHCSFHGGFNTPLKCWSSIKCKFKWKLLHFKALELKFALSLVAPLALNSHQRKYLISSNHFWLSQFWSYWYKNDIIGNLIDCSSFPYKIYFDYFSIL